MCPTARWRGALRSAETRANGPPFAVGLKPWATEVAADLHRRFGDDVKVFVGHFYYPDSSRGERPAQGQRRLLRSWDPSEMVVELEGPVVVSPGDNVRGWLRVHNPSRRS